MTTTKNKNYWFDITNGIVPEFKTFQEIQNYCIEKLGMKYVASLEIYSLKTFQIYINEDFQVVLLPKDENVDDFYNFFKYFKEGSDIKNFDDLLPLNTKQKPYSDELKLFLTFSVFSAIIHNGASLETKHLKHPYFGYKEKMIYYLYRKFEELDFYFGQGTCLDAIILLLKILHNKAAINTFHIANYIVKQTYMKKTVFKNKEKLNESFRVDNLEVLYLAQDFYLEDFIRKEYDGFKSLSPHMAFYFVINDIVSINTIINNELCSFKNTILLIDLISSSEILKAFKPNSNWLLITEKKKIKLKAKSLFLNPKEMNETYIDLIDSTIQMAKNKSNKAQVLKNVLSLIGTTIPEQQLLFDAYIPYCGNQELIELYSLN